MNLPIATIEAIETNDQTHLPAQVFTRGYVRAYAKLLEVDAEPLVAALGDEPVTDEASRQGGADAVPGAGQRAQRVDVAQLMQPKYLGTAAAAVLIVVAFAWWFAGDDVDVPAEAVQAQPAGQATADQQMPSKAQPAASAVLAEAEDIPVEDEAPQDTVEASEPPAPAIDTAQVNATQPPPDLPAAVTDEPDAAAETSAAIAASTTDAARRLTADGEDRLSLEFTEECWVEIKDTQGQLLYGDLGRAGQRMEFVGAAPFRLLLGYAPGVLLSFNSEPVALTPHTRNNVASLVLGQ